MSNIPTILKLDIRDVLWKLWYGSNHYQIKWNNIIMKDNWVLTWWWRGQLIWEKWTGFLVCQSWKKPWITDNTGSSSNLVRE